MLHASSGQDRLSVYRKGAPDCPLRTVVTASARLLGELSGFNMFGEPCKRSPHARSDFQGRPARRTASVGTSSHALSKRWGASSSAGLVQRASDLVTFLMELRAISLPKVSHQDSHRLQPPAVLVKQNTLIQMLSQAHEATHTAFAGIANRYR